MNESLAVLNAVIPIFGIIAIGLVIRRLNWLTQEADESLLRVNVNLLLPCLILDATLGNPALSQARNLLLAPLVGFGTLALGLAVARALKRVHGLTEPAAERTFRLCIGIYNYGYIPLPLSMLLFDRATTGVLMLHNVGVETGLWTLGVMALKSSGTRWEWKKILNPPLAAILLALILNAFGAAPHVPPAARSAVRWLGECAVPMALVLIGAIIADHVGDFHSESGWRVIGSGVVLRLVLLPFAFLLLAKVLPASIELKRVMVLEAAMPSAVFPIIMARHYGGDPPTALRVVIGTSVVGLATIPLWIRFGMKFVGV